MGISCSSNQKAYVHLSRCSRCSHMVDPRLNHKRCKAHIEKLSDKINPNTKEQECINCKRKFIIGTMYTDGCIKQYHIFDEDTCILIKKRDEYIVKLQKAQK